MDVSWEDAARSSPVPRRPPPRAAPSPDDWELERKQANARLAAEQLGTDFRARLDRLSRRQEWAIACCAYLDNRELEAARTPILDDLQDSYARLADDYDQALRAEAGALPAEELDGWVGRFRDICEARRANLGGDSQRLPELIELRRVIERGHAERAGDAVALTGQAVTLGMLQGLIVMASRLGSDRMAVGLVGPMVTAAQALASVWPAGEEERPPPTGPVPAGGDRLGPAVAAPGCAVADHGLPRCVCLDTGQHGAGYPLIYLVDAEEPDQGANDPLAPSEKAAADGSAAWYASGQDGARPTVGLVVRGPARSVATGHRGLDAARLADFARSAIFHGTYDGTPRTAAVAVRAAQALEAVALVDPATGGGVWVDVNRSSQEPAATFLIEDCASDRMTFIRS